MTGKTIVRIVCAVLVVAGVALCGFWFLSGFGSSYYYTQIDNSKLTQVPPRGMVDLSGNGGMDYSYTLPSYDEGGGEADVTFGVSRELREDAFLRLTVQPGRGVLNWSEVQYDELPPAVQAHYAVPAGG